MRKIKGAVMQSAIVFIILSVISGAILLAFTTRFHKVDCGIDPQKREVCRTSVIIRSNALTKGEFKYEYPLKCETEYIKIKTTDREKIKKCLADIMYDCWYMLGEGKINFFKQDPTLKRYTTHCVICAVIEFDEKVQEEIPQINLKELYEYLTNKKIPTKNITYWQYFTLSENPTTILEDKDFPYIYTNKKYAVIFGLAERSTLLGTVAGGAGGLIGVKTGAGIGALIGSIIPIGGTAAGAIIGGGIGLVIGSLGGYLLEQKAEDLLQAPYYFIFNLVPYEANEIKNFGCDRIENIP